MQNTRPVYNIELPLRDGTTVTCTLKQPTIDLRKEVRALGAKEQSINLERAGMLQTLNLASSHLGDCRVKLSAAKFEALGGDAESMARIPQLELDLAKAIGARDFILAEMESTDTDAEKIKLERLGAIVNIPNDGSGNRRSWLDVDEGAIDAIEIDEAIVFFNNGKRS